MPLSGGGEGCTGEHQKMARLAHLQQHYGALAMSCFGFWAGLGVWDLMRWRSSGYWSVKKKGNARGTHNGLSKHAP